MDTEITAEISYLQYSDLDDIVALNEEYLYYGPAVRPHFEEVLSYPDNILLKGTVNNKFAGALTCVKGIALLGEHRELISRIERMTEGKTVYTGDSVAVRKEYRHSGLSNQLVAAVKREMWRRGAEWAVHEFWVHPNGSIPALKAFSVFEKSIFLGRYENFYSSFSDIGYFCPICGENCVCSAEIYLIEIEDSGDELKTEEDMQ